MNIGGNVSVQKTDFRSLKDSILKYDVIVTTAVLHHLRDDDDWKDAFKMLYSLLNEGGSLWVFDLVEQNNVQMQKIIYEGYYGEYLMKLKDEKYKQTVFDYIAHEDSPRSLLYQLDLAREVGFSSVDILHKNLNFASYVAFK